MIINSNLSAMNTIRQLGINEQATQSSLAKLSSGLRINSAADDAAGLSISEKMRGQISGLNTASTNAQTGINLAATAEGALNTSTSILQRMRELAVQGANGTNTSSDNTAMSDEFNQLKSALDDIGNQTQFNTKNLLDGSQAGAAGVSVGQNATTGAIVGTLAAGTIASASAASMGSGSVSLATAFAQETVNIDGSNIKVNWQNLSTTDQATIKSGFAAGASTTDQNAAASLIVSTINSAIDQSGTNVAHVSGYVDSSNKLNIVSGSTGINSDVTATGSGVLGTAMASATVTAGSDKYGGPTVNKGATYNVSINGIQMQVTSSATLTSGITTMAAVATDLQTDLTTAVGKYDVNAGNLTSGEAGFIKDPTVNATGDGRLQVLSESGSISFSDTPGNVSTTSLGLNSAQTSAGSSGGLTFQIGANAGQTLTFGIDDMRSSALGLTNVNVDSVASASAAITAIDSATAQVSAERSKLGAIQNRLTDTISNLGTSSQNITSAEADIRDVDMASEMTNFQKNNVLQQAATSMLAQANQQPQNVLKLLQ